MNPTPIQFDTKQWIKDNIPETYYHRAVKILDGNYITEHQVNAIMNMAQRIQYDEDKAEIESLKATVKGVTDALQCKNSTEVTVHTASWPSVVIFTILMLFFYLLHVHH